MTKNEIHAILEDAGVRPNRKLGQNFLIDENFLDWIVRESGAAPGVKIIEVGPGFGALTKRMLETGAEVAAVEYDHRIADWLRKNLVPKGLKLFEGDACKFDFDSVYGKGTEYKLVSNLPYSAGTAVAAELFDAENPPPEMVIMLQKEVAMRLAAVSGDEAYGSLSVRASAVYTVAHLRTAPPEMFFPRPEVDSSVIRLKKKENCPGWEFRKKLSRLVRLAFGQRRKKMFKQLTSLAPKERFLEIYQELGIREDARPEHVTAEQFIAMAKLLIGEGKL